ncbi:MAG: DUF3990 domain-containing protein [Lachnospiraceae bacterium]|nr:DUF3990 domain-containing protein [Lachnospiraceae bacterium]
MKKSEQKQLILYHGSAQIIKKPEYGKGKYTNDYGPGFYCTEQRELAGEWACGSDSDGFINKYKLDWKGLKILDFKSPEFSVLNWLAVLLRYRMVDMDSPIMLSAREYIREKYYVDLSEYDVIRGYRADDSYFSFVRAFISNTISLEQLTAAMHLGNLGEQIVIKSTEAFNKLFFIEAFSADHREYFPRKKDRDNTAREEYKKIAAGYDSKGIYVSEIISGMIGEDDERIRKALFI